MTDFTRYGKQAATFTTKEPTPVTCAKQLLCVPGFALPVAWGLDITSAPAEYPSQLRARWQDANEAGIREQRCITLLKAS